MSSMAKIRPSTPKRTPRATRPPSLATGSRLSSVDCSNEPDSSELGSLRITSKKKKASTTTRRTQTEGAATRKVKQSVDISNGGTKDKSPLKARKSARKSALKSDEVEQTKESRKDTATEGVVVKKKTPRKSAIDGDDPVERKKISKKGSSDDSMSKKKTQKSSGIASADGASSKTPQKSVDDGEADGKGGVLQYAKSPTKSTTTAEKGAKGKKLRKNGTPLVSEEKATVGTENKLGEALGKPVPRKLTSKDITVTLLNKFSFKNDEKPSAAKKKKKKKLGSGKPSVALDGCVTSSGGKSGVSEKKQDSQNGIHKEETPDVIFHKRMTKEKLSLLARSPLSRLLSQKEKDAAAEEVYGEGAKFSMQAKRKMDVTDEDDVILLNVNAQPPRKKSRTEKGAEDEPVTQAQLTARRKENRKLKRKVRQMKARGELPDEEKETPEAGVVYLGHIPHGFYEKEMRGYFSQFGEVTRVRLSRSKKTARSRGFAFIEFADKEVATKAGESMDGYLMHGQALVAKLVPPEKVHPDTFKGANRVFKKIPFSAIERRAMIQRSRDPAKLSLRSKGVQKKVNAKKDKLARKGIKYEFPEVTPSIEA